MSAGRVIAGCYICKWILNYITSLRLWFCIYIMNEYMDNTTHRLFHHIHFLLLSSWMLPVSKLNQMKLKYLLHFSQSSRCYVNCTTWVYFLFWSSLSRMLRLQQMAREHLDQNHAEHAYNPLNHTITPFHHPAEDEVT